MLSSKIEKPFCKYNGFHTWKCVENVHINNVDLSLVESVRIPYMKKLPPYYISDACGLMRIWLSIFKDYFSD